MEPIELMECNTGIDLGSALETAVWGVGATWFRGGLPFSGDGRPIPADDACAEPPDFPTRRVLMHVNWGPSVSWRKKVRVTG
jgi:hypothetical protein